MRRVIDRPVTVHDDLLRPADPRRVRRHPRHPNTRDTRDTDERTLELRRQVGLLLLGAGDTGEAHRLLTELLADLERARGPADEMARDVRELLADVPDESW